MKISDKSQKISFLPWFNRKFNGIRCKNLETNFEMNFE